MREGSGAISAGDRDQLMRMYKSGLSGLPVVRRQNNAQVGNPLSENALIRSIIDAFTPYAETTRRVSEANARRLEEQPSLLFMGPGSVPGADVGREGRSKLASETLQRLNPLETVGEKQRRQAREADAKREIESEVIQAESDPRVDLEVDDTRGALEPLSLADKMDAAPTNKPVGTDIEVDKGYTY